MNELRKREKREDAEYEEERGIVEKDEKEGDACASDGTPPRLGFDLDF